MNLKTNNTKRLYVLLAILIYLSFGSLASLYFYQMRDGFDAVFLNWITMGDISLSLPYLSTGVIILLAILVPTIVFQVVLKLKAGRAHSDLYITVPPKKEKDEAVIRVKLLSPETNSTFEDYFNYRYQTKIFILPGFRSGLNTRKVAVVFYYLMSLLPLMEGNYLVVGVLISIPFIMFGFEGIINKAKRKTDLLFKIFVLFCFILIFTMSTYFSVLEIKIGNFQSNFVVNVLCEIPDNMKRLNIDVDSEKIYNTAVVFGRTNPLPYFKKARDQEVKGDLKNAEISYLIAIVNGADNYEVHYRLGRLYVYMGENDRALRELKKTQSQNPTFAPAFYEAAALFLEKGDIKEAERLTESALKADKNDWNAYKIKSRVLLAENKYPEALQAINKAIEISPKTVSLYREKAEALLKTGNLEEALFTAKAAIKIKIDDAESYYLLGTILSRKYEYIEAADQFKKAISIKPDYALSRGGLALAAMGTGDLKAAKEEMDRALQNSDLSAPMHFMNARLQSELGNYTKALSEIESALTIDGSQSIYFSLKGEILLNSHQYENVEEQFKKALSLDSYNEHAYFVKGMFLLQLDNFIAAEEAFKASLKVNPRMSRAYAGRAVALNAMNDSKGADESLEIAMGLNASDFFCYYAKSIVHYERKLNLKAQEDINKAIELNPGVVSLYIHKSRILKALNMEAERNTALEKAAGIDTQAFELLLEYAGKIQNSTIAAGEFEKIIKKYPREFNGYLFKAEWLFKQKKYKEALDAVNLGIDTNPNSYKVYLLKYKILTEQRKTTAKTTQDYKDILAALKKLNEVNSFFGDAYYYKGIVLLEQKTYAEAVNELNKALEFESNYYLNEVKRSDVYRALYSSYIGLKQAQKSDEVLKRMEGALKLEQLNLIK